MKPGRNPLPIALGLVLVLALAVVLRIWMLGSESLWLDEAHSLSQARRWWGAAWRNEALTDPNPPLYFTLLHFWVRAFGESEETLRALSVVFGTMTVGIVFVLGWLCGGSSLGLAGAALAATSPMLVMYSREARGYAFAIMAASVALCGAFYLLARDQYAHRVDRTRDSSAMRLAWCAYVAGTVCAVYTHTTLVLLPIIINAAALAAWLFGARWDRRTVLAWLLANAAVLVAYLPWLPNVVANRAIGDFWIGTASVTDAVQIVRAVYGQPFTPALQPGLDIAVASLAAFGIIGIRAARPVRFIVAAVIILPPLLTYIVSLYRPILIPRVLLWPIPALLVAVAAGALCLPGRARTAAVAGLVIVHLAGLRDAGATTKHEPWREVVSRLAAHRQPGDIVFLLPAYAAMPLEYYAGIDRDILAIELREPPRPSTRWSYEVIAPDDIPLHMSGRARAWLVTRHGDDVRLGTETIAARMALTMPLTQEERFQRLTVRLFVRQP